MKTLTVNMKQFRANWKVYSDNLIAYETIIACNGKLVTSNPGKYINWLNNFAIFYTLKG